MKRFLQAYINQIHIGTLEENLGIWSFTYTDSWVNDPQNYALCPSLPIQSQAILDSSSQRPVQWYFDNLLPEENQRKLLAKDAKIDAADSFALLQCYGAESAGSITLVVENEDLRNKSSIQSILDAELEKRILDMPKIPLAHHAEKRMSLAGAQHKLAIIYQNNDFYEPSGETASSHILKPDHPDEEYPHSVINEWFIMRLAKSVGIKTPNVYRRYVPSPVFIIERFDRTPKKNMQDFTRLHAIDACQLMGIDRVYKYNQGSIDILNEITKRCRNAAAAKTSLFTWIIFNVLVGNSDAHLKNISFLVNHEGIELAPFYDLLSIATYDTQAYDQTGWPHKTKLAWPLLGVQEFAKVEAQLIIETGNQLGIAKQTSTRILKRLLETIIVNANALYDEVINENRILLENNTQIAATLTGELRLLRTFIHIILKPMCVQLQPN